MTESRRRREALYLLALRSIVYGAAGTLLAVELTGSPGIVGSWVGVVAGVWIASHVAVSRLRTILALLVGGLVVALGIWSETLLAGHTFLASRLGPARTIHLVQFCTFGFLLGGAVFGLRILGSRWSALGILEPIAVAALVVRLFVRHRNLQLGEPRFLCDWAFSHGINPFHVLMAIGTGTLFLTLILILEAKKLSRGLSAILLLALIGGGSYYWAKSYKPSKTNDPLLEPGGGGKEEPHQMGFKPAKGEGDGSSSNRPQVTALVLFRDDYDPPYGTYYFRTGAESQFNGTKLVTATAPGLDREVPIEYPQGTIHLPTPQCELDEEHVVRLKTTVNLTKELARPIGLITPVSMTSQDNANPEFFFRTYDVESEAITAEYKALLRRTAGNPEWSDEQRKHYLQFPGDPRYLDLAKEITASLKRRQATDPIYVAVTISQWLSKNIWYTKQADYSWSPDPTAAFLFGERKGYCVYIAHSLAYLLRALAIPCRAASGYAVPSKRREGSQLMILSREAHQWVEVYVDGVGWVVVDVGIPPDRNLDPQEPEPDPELQRLLAEKAREKPPIPKIKPGERRRCPVGKWYSLLGLLVPLVLLYAVKLWRRYIPRVASAKSLYRVSYRATLDRLSEVGYHRKFGETREAFAERVSSVAPPFPELTRLHLKGALGHGEPLPRERWRELESQVSEALRRNRPRMRRILGWINPLSWFWSR